MHTLEASLGLNTLAPLLFAWRVGQAGGAPVRARLVLPGAADLAPADLGPADFAPAAFFPDPLLDRSFR